MYVHLPLYFLHHVAILQAIGVLLYYFETDPTDNGGNFGWSFYTCCGSTVVLALGVIVLFMNAIVVCVSNRREYHRIN